MSGHLSSARLDAFQTALKRARRDLLRRTRAEELLALLRAITAGHTDAQQRVSEELLRHLGRRLSPNESYHWDKESGRFVAGFAIATPEAALQFLRENNTALRPEMVLALVYARRWSALRPDGLALLATQYPGRRELLVAVYGEGAAALAVPKRASAEKRLLVDRLLKESRRKYPWMTSRLIHAMAFRPAHFETSRPRLASPGIEPWGPLYSKRKRLKGGGGTRILLVPNPPLKRLQSAVLRVIGPHLLTHVSECVYGFGVDGHATTFDNAVRHIGYKYIATFDLADFFPSIRLQDLLVVLRTLSGPMFLAEDRPLPPAVNMPRIGASSPPVFSMPVRWSGDAALLVAALCTCRRRLPQGAPTSPLLSAIAFLPFDKSIGEAIGTGITYTRYFDDLTFSITASEAKARGFGSARDFGLDLRDRLGIALAGSPFRIRENKSRYAEASPGLRVTGIRVLRDRIDVPRGIKRRVRVLGLLLNKPGSLVRLAERDDECRRLPSEVRRYPTSIQGVWTFRRQGRQLGLEKSAVRMLLQLEPSLVLELPPDDLQRQRGLSPNKIIHSRSELRRVLDRIVSHLWSGAYTAGAETEGQVAVEHAGREVAFLRAPRVSGFFRLSASQAQATTVFWMRCQGLSSYLAGVPASPTTSGVRDLGMRLREVLGGREIRADETPDRRITAASGELGAAPLTIEDDVPAVANEVLELVADFRKSLGGSSISRADEQAFCRPAASQEDFDNWVVGCRHICLDFGRLPRDRTRQGGGLARPLNALRLWSDVCSGKRVNGYADLAEVRSRWPPAAAGRHAETQILLLKEIARVFRQSRADRLRAPERWLDSLAATQSDDFENLLGQEAQSFATLRAELRSTGRQYRVFRADTEASERDSHRKVARSVAREPTTDKVRLGLFEMGEAIYKLTWEMIDYRRDRALARARKNRVELITGRQRHIQEGLKKLVKPKGEVIGKIALLRNRGVHVLREDHWESARALQRDFARRLGRLWQSPKGDPFGRDQMELTGFEGMELKVSYLRDVNEFLRALRDADPEAIRTLQTESLRDDADRGARPGR